MEAYSENTDETNRTAFYVYVKLALHLISLLTVDVECTIDVSKLFRFFSFHSHELE